MARNRIVSQAQIAEILGISRSAVSFALKDSPKIGPRTRQRVRKLCDQLRYRPNAQASSLARASTRTVGVACGPITDSYQALIVSALERELRKHEFVMLMQSSTVDSFDRAWERAMVFVDHRVCGIILLSDSALYTRLTQTYPGMFAMVNLGNTTPHAPSITGDYDAAGRAVAEHLLSLRTKRWAVNVTKSQLDAVDRPKTRAFVRAALDAGLASPVEILLEDVYFESHLDEYGRVVTEAVMREHPDVDAFFFSCDDIALGAIAWLVEAGYRVPQDVAVVGFNDAPFASTSAVPLTTVHQPVDQYARIAIEMLIDQIGHGNRYSGESRVIPCELVVRRSTDPNCRLPKPKTSPATLRFLEPQSVKPSMSVRCVQNKEREI